MHLVCARASGGHNKAPPWKRAQRFDAFSEVQFSIVLLCFDQEWKN